jgi:RNA polymerase sigma factor (sigma-70 family)
MSDRVLKVLTDPLKVDDQIFFARAYREHYPALLSFVRRRVGSDSEAADIAQETYLRVLRYRNEQDVAALKALLFQIALNLLTDRARLARTEHRAETIPLEDELPVIADDPSQYRQVAGSQDLQRALAAVEKLPRKCREVFVLRRLQGMNHQQIAERLGISVKAVERHMTRAIHECRKKVGEYPR